jgi:uncharacterized protein YjbI with pentapeptide repeats
VIFGEEEVYNGRTSGPDTYLAGANLSGTNLSGAILISTSLAGANLMGARLVGANVSYMSLAGVTRVDGSRCERPLRE